METQLTDCSQLEHHKQNAALIYQQRLWIFIHKTKIRFPPSSHGWYTSISDGEVSTAKINNFRSKYAVIRSYKIKSFYNLYYVTFCYRGCMNFTKFRADYSVAVISSTSKVTSTKQMHMIQCMIQFAPEKNNLGKWERSQRPSEW